MRLLRKPEFPFWIPRSCPAYTQPLSFDLANWMFPTGIGLRPRKAQLSACTWFRCSRMAPWSLECRIAVMSEPVECMLLGLRMPKWKSWMNWVGSESAIPPPPSPWLPNRPTSVEIGPQQAPSRPENGSQTARRFSSRKRGNGKRPLPFRPDRRQCGSWPPCCGSAKAAQAPSIKRGPARRAPTDNTKQRSLREAFTQLSAGWLTPELPRTPHQDRQPAQARCDLSSQCPRERCPVSESQTPEWALPLATRDYNSRFPDATALRPPCC